MVGRRTRLWGYFIGAIALVVLGLPWLHPLPVQASPARHYDQIESPPLPEITIPEYSRFELPNGLIVYLVEDHELPIVTGTSVIRTGDRVEPADKVGLASLVGEVMRSGGTTLRTGEDLNQLLEQKAASVETGIDTTAAGASFNSLTEDVEEVFRLFAEVLRYPAFPDDKITLAKSQWQGSIARRNDNPERIASREFSKLIYGAESPYARTVEYATLNSITRADLVAFHQTYFHPNNMLLGIVGDFETQAMRSLIEQAFGDWEADPTVEQPSFAALPDVTQAKPGGIFVVDQPQLTQSYIQLGHLGGELRDPDYTALSVLNEILNGFGGRLVNEVRSRQGLAYVVYAFWNPTFDYPGVFVGGGQTRTDATVPFIQSLKAEIEKVRTVPVTQAELDQAKDSVLNAFIFNFQTPFQLIYRLMRYEYYGYPPDFIFQYQRAVEATTPEQIVRAAQTHLKPDQLVTLVVGNLSGIDPALTTLGPVTPIDITIPQ